MYLLHANITLVITKTYIAAYTQDVKLKHYE